MTYAKVYAAWQNDPEGFWMDQARAIDWVTAPTRAIERGASSLSNR